MTLAPKRQKNLGSPMCSEAIERDQWHEMNEAVD